MRAICKVCKDKDNCSYLANNKTSDCIDVQTSDYGYEEAVDKACEVYRNELQEIVNILNSVGEMNCIAELGDILSLDGCVRDFKKAMEE